MENYKYIIEVQDLQTTFQTDNGEVHAVNGINFNLEPGKTLGIVGESGSGKSVSAYSIMQILADNGAITGVGTHDELLNNNSIYQEVYYSQTRTDDNDKEVNC